MHFRLRIDRRAVRHLAVHGFGLTSLLALLGGCSLRDFDRLGAGGAPVASTSSPDDDEDASTAPSSEAGVIGVPSSSASVDDLDGATSPSVSGSAMIPVPDAQASTAPPASSQPEDAGMNTDPDTSVDPVGDGGVTPPQGPVTIVHATFENGLDGWVPFGASSLVRQSGGCYQGNGCARSTNRNENFEGPGYQLLASALPGKLHDVTGWVKLLASGPGPVQPGDAGADAAAPPSVTPQVVGITVAIQCSGEDFVYTAIEQASVGGDWVKLSNSFTAPDCDFDNLWVYFEKPSPGTEFLLDEAEIIAHP